MSYVCLYCWEVYDNSVEKLRTNVSSEKDQQKSIIFCPKTDCSSGEVVEIDELYIPVIKYLNEKGYMTKYCCSGHIYDNCTNSYIVFHESVEELPNIPEGAYMEKDTTIRIGYDYPENATEFELHDLIMENARKVLKWVNELPERGKFICSYEKRFK